MELRPPLAPVFAIAALAASAAARDLELAHAGGILGHGLAYELVDSTGSAPFFLVLPSITEGPTPAGPFTLDVGVELIGAAASGAFGAGGAAEAAYVLPANPALSELKLFAQAIAFELGPGGVLVTDASNRVEVTLGSEGEVQVAPDEQVEARRAAVVVSLPDCRPIGAGGETPTSPAGYLSSIEVYDAQTERFEPIGDLVVPRAHATGTLLHDGRVLIAGGVGEGGTVLAATEVFDPTTGESKLVGPMNGARVFHTATLLEDGRVLVVGGSTTFDEGHPLGSPATLLGPLRSSAELFDPVTETWAPGPSLPAGRTSHRATRLPSGLVLVTGGVRRPPSGPASTTASCRYYVPAPAPGVGSFAPAPPLPAPRAMHGQTATEGGGVLVVGGSDVDFSTPLVTGTSTTFVFDGAALLWSAGPAAAGVYTCQDLLCVPSKHPIAPATTYVTGGGWSDLHLVTGAGTVQLVLTEISSDLASARDVGSMTKPRLGVRLAPADMGFRVLVTGAGPRSGGSPDHTADLWIRRY